MSPSETSTERGGPLARSIGLFGGAALFLFFLYGPDVGLDPLQRRVAATTALTAFLWVTVAIPVGAASLFPVALFPLLGVMSAREAAPLYMNQLVLLFIGAFIVAIGLERCTLTQPHSDSSSNSSRMSSRRFEVRSLSRNVQENAHRSVATGGGGVG